MKIYLLWTISGVVIGETDDTQPEGRLTNPIRVYRPLRFAERVEPQQPGTNDMSVHVGFLPMLMTAYIPHVDVNWIMAVSVMSLPEAEAVAGLVIAGPGQVPKGPIGRP